MRVLGCLLLAACVTFAAPSFAVAKPRPYRIVKPLQGVEEIQVVGIRKTRGGKMIADLKVTGHSLDPLTGSRDSVATMSLVPNTWMTVAYGNGVRHRLLASQSGEVQKEYKFQNTSSIRTNHVLNVEVSDVPWPGTKRLWGTMWTPGNRLKLLPEEASGFQVRGDALVGATADVSMRLGQAGRSLDGTQFEADSLAFAATVPNDGQLHLGTFGRKQVTLQFDGDELRSMSVVMPGR